MKKPFEHIYDWATNISHTSVIAVVALIAATRITFGHIPISVQLVIALIALVIGIPHGAIDHLISIPRKPNTRFYAYIVLYTLIAIVAGWAIATWNLNGFRAVVIMSALHFGFGDASFLNESQDAAERPRHSFINETLYAIPAGFLPVFLPLTDSRTLSALERINPGLDNWAGDYSELIRTIIIVIGMIAILSFAAQKNVRFALDLSLLMALSLIAPPLIAFATYFGMWHALRHTARLVPKLPKAQDLALSGNWKAAIRSAIFPGLYAVAATLVVAVLLPTFFPNSFSYGLLWTTLLIVWALTVPHMLSTARFDLKALPRK